MDTPHLEAHKLVRSTDPGTSWQAASRVGEFAHRHHKLVMGVIAGASGPLGAEQIADACGLGAYEVRKRLPELQADGLIELAEGTRTTRSGRRERLWARAKPRT